MSRLIESIEKAHLESLKRSEPVPDFRAGDTLRVSLRVTEGQRTRIQAYEGVCIAMSGRGVNATFTVRKISYGVGVERKFSLFSPLIESVKVIRHGRVRRAKLYYMRQLRGRAARIRERKVNVNNG